MVNFNAFGGADDSLPRAFLSTSTSRPTGPTRAARWTRQRPGLPEEEFIETIPFTETRFYVRIVLANREEYRRLYGLGPSPAPANGGARP